MNLRIYYKYLSSRIASKWTVLLVDVIIVVISMLSACFLQYRLSSVSYEISLYVWLTIWAVLCNICFFHILRTYVGVIRFSSFVKNPLQHPFVWQNKFPKLYAAL